MTVMMMINNNNFVFTLLSLLLVSLATDNHRGGSRGTSGGRVAGIQLHRAQELNQALSDLASALAENTTPPPVKPAAAAPPPSPPSASASASTSASANGVPNQAPPPPPAAQYVARKTSTGATVPRPIHSSATTPPAQQQQQQEQHAQPESLLSTEERARVSTRAAMTEATAALEKIKAYENEQGGVYDYAFAEARSGDEAHEIFCKCDPHPSMGKELYAMCPGITEQCKRSFCKPLCLRMGWKPTVTVDCAKAPTWKWCPKYAAQVRVAQKAIEAQFQAHVCMDLHFCNETHHMNQWIENHSYGMQYPNPHLPIDGCQHKNATDEQNELLCAACETVTDVDIIRGECMPRFTAMQPGSLQERCLYLADVITNRRDFLQQIFKDRVCSCLGCCGTGKCFFQNPEEDWLKTLVASVSDRVTNMLEEEGWAIMKKHQRRQQAQRKKDRPSFP